MTESLRLSICVPSRNRQYYFQKTIEGLLRNPRTDVEFVFADNSDDPSIMNEYMREVGKDPRVVYLPSAERTLSMMDNWERTLEASTGDWVTFIGDDDFVDPDVMTVLAKSVAVSPELEAFSWDVVAYTWPTENSRSDSILIPFNSFVVKVPREQSLKRMFGWYDSGSVPSSGFSIYHSAVSRPLLERIRAMFGGRYFEYPVVDYEMAMKVIVAGREFAFCQRPFSIMGSCPESNSYATSNLDRLKKRLDVFMNELGRNSDEDGHLRDFPFGSSLGLTATIAIAMHWFKEKYNFRFGGWEKSFACACMQNTEMFRDRESFDIVKNGYVAAFTKWEGGKYLKHFDPVFKGHEVGITLSGSNENGTYIRSDIAGIKTPEGLQNIINAMTTPADLVRVRPEGLRYPWDEERLCVDGSVKPVQVRAKEVA